jgi:hypothetical protein
MVKIFDAALKSFEFIELSEERINFLSFTLFKYLEIKSHQEDFKKVDFYSQKEKKWWQKRFKQRSTLKGSMC